MLKLTIDDRESKVIPFFKEEYPDIELEVKRIQVGDYVISFNDIILFVIERKTWSDLASSIKDGRKENVNKLINLREKTNCKIVYLMEGKSRFAAAKKIGRIPYKNLQAHLDHLIMRDNIFVIHSSSLEDTVDRLIEFMKNYLSLNIVHPLNATLSAEGGSAESSKETHMNILTTTIPKTDLEIMYKIWNCISNVTDKTATLFIEKEIHISDILLNKIPKTDISTMKYPNGSIIGKRADKIIKTSNDVFTHKKMLACCPMVTKETAALILETISFEDLLENKIPIENIANINKNSKSKTLETQSLKTSKIGKKASENIFKYFVNSKV